MNSLFKAALVLTVLSASPAWASRVLNCTDGKGTTAKIRYFMPGVPTTAQLKIRGERAPHSLACVVPINNQVPGGADIIRPILFCDEASTVGGYSLLVSQGGFAGLTSADLISKATDKVLSTLFCKN